MNLLIRIKCKNAMKNKKVTLFVVLFLPMWVLLFTGCNNQTTMKAPKIDLKDFFRNPEKSSYQISPNGQYYAYMAPYERRMNVFVQEVGGGEPVRLTHETDRDIAGYFWANDNRILYLKDNGGDENFKLYGVNTDGDNLICLTDFDEVRTTVIDDLEDIPDEIIIGMNKRDKRVFDPYRLNITTGEMEMIAENPGNIMGWLTDHDGQLRVAIASDGVNQNLLYRDTEEEDFRIVLTTSFKETASPLFFTFDNKNVYAVSNLGRDKAALVEFDIANGKEIRTLFEHTEYDVSRASYSRKDKVLQAAYYTSWKMERHFFDEKFKTLIKKLESELGEGKYEIGIYDATKEEDKFIVGTSNDKTRVTYYLYDRNSGELTFIHKVCPWLDENQMADMYPVKYKSRDGLTVHGYLTLPKGTDKESAKNMPVIVNPHGGPSARDSWGFNPEVQFLANRGYGVLQVNFRGSTGYGRSFWEAGFKRWGKEMQDDITDGVNWIIEEGIADEDRVAIYGGSYGGYATLAGLAFTPDVYCCGVDYVGVSNVFTILENIPPYWEPLREMMYEMIGDPVKDSAFLAEISPVFHADRITAPLFIAQGANDPRVKKIESDQMVEAMLKRGVEVEYMVKDNEGHGFRNEENQFEFYEAMEAFLEVHMK